MVDIQFYRNQSLPNTVTKTLTSVANYPGEQLRNVTGDDNVAIRVSTDAQNLDPTKCNYMRVNASYYYVTEVVAVANGTCEVRGALDVLHTYRSAIQSLRVLADRSTNQGSMELRDGGRKFSARKTRTIIPFPNEIDENYAYGTYVLVTAQDKYEAV